MTQLMQVQANIIQQYTAFCQAFFKAAVEMQKSALEDIGMLFIAL